MSRLIDRKNLIATLSTPPCCRPQKTEIHDDGKAGPSYGIDQPEDDRDGCRKHCRIDNNIISLGTGLQYHKARRRHNIGTLDQILYPNYIGNYF